MCESCAGKEASTVTMVVSSAHLLMTCIAYSSGFLSSVLCQWLGPPPDCMSTVTTRGRGGLFDCGKRLVIIGVSLSKPHLGL